VLPSFLLASHQRTYYFTCVDNIAFLHVAQSGTFRSSCVAGIMKTLMGEGKTFLSFLRIDPLPESRDYLNARSCNLWTLQFFFFKGCGCLSLASVGALVGPRAARFPVSASVFAAAIRHRADPPGPSPGVYLSG